MAIVSTDELLKQIKEALGDNLTSDVGISLMENVTDTLNSVGDTKQVDSLNKQIADLQEKLETTEKTWRTKYVERFESGTPKENVDDPSVVTPKVINEVDDSPQTFDDLFTFEKKGD